MDRVFAARQRYAAELAAMGPLESQALIDAFARVPREDYLGPGPWKIMGFPNRSSQTPDSDPTPLYANVLVEIDRERRANNGEPLLHARLIESLAPRTGEHVVHIGAGTGYYSAILAELVGDGGRVTAIEYDAGLAAKLRANAASHPQLTALHADGTSYPFDDADCIYVSAGASHPLGHWLDRLLPGGRMIAPITNGLRGWVGFVLRAERLGDQFRGRFISPVGIFPCIGGHDERADAVLDEAMQRDGERWREVNSLRRDAHARDTSCWVHGDGYCLSTREVLHQ